jgi:phospholipid-binding lipoprotein MlaA
VSKSKAFGIVSTDLNFSRQACLISSIKPIFCALVLMVTMLCSSGLHADNYGDPRDPWEGVNRSVFAFNEVTDAYLLKPVARGYRKVTPAIVDQGIANFFNNIGEIKNAGNDILQGQGEGALVDAGRFVINTTVGLLGFFDVASYIGLKRESEDFGQTLAVWGVETGPYLVLPIFGPSTLRDGVGRVVDSYSSVTNSIDPEQVSYGMTALDLLQTRASLLATEGLVTGDKYTFFKDAYLQRREFLINDGQLKDDFGDEDFESFDF